MKALNRNKMRTALTMLGMIIGVGAVITMVALGTGAQSSIEEQIKSAGTNMIMINAGNFTQGGVRMGQGATTRLTEADARAVSQIPGVQYAAAGVSTRVQIVAGNQNWSTRAEGTDVDPADHPLVAHQVRRLLHAAGRRRAPPRSVVLGSVVRDTLFGRERGPDRADRPHQQHPVHA